jgi:hypothetical protein
MKALAGDIPFKITIRWTRPRSYSDALESDCEHDYKAGLYLISARYSNLTPKGIYVGKTWDQYVSLRLRQRDHRARYSSFHRLYSRHAFSVSYGILKFENGRMTKKRLGEIERILIYSNDPTHSQNRSGIWKHSVSDSYEIRNTGYRCSLPKRVSLGIFTS